MYLSLKTCIIEPVSYISTAECLSFQAAHVVWGVMDLFA